MNRTPYLALLLCSLILVSFHASARANPPQGKGKSPGLNTREFDTQIPAEAQSGNPARKAAPCIEDDGSSLTIMADPALIRNEDGSPPSKGMPLPCEPPPPGPTWYLGIANFERLVVSDAHGNTDRLYEEEVAFQTVQSVSYNPFGTGDTGVMVVAPVGETYTFKFKPSGIMRLDLVRGVDNTHPDVAVRYLDLNLPRGTWALLKLTPAGIEDLRVDMNGDGNFETTISPTASANGPEARDWRGPVIRFDAATRGTGVLLLTINAEDPSGVRRLIYSLDGTRFSPYAGPFEVNPARVRKVWALADDGLGNRSLLYTYEIGTGRTNPDR
jgi:hypothetical protein